jgi:hypothetical protein
MNYAYQEVGPNPELTEIDAYGSCASSTATGAASST